MNIIGFAIDDDELRSTFESWAALGNGDYFSAADADQLAAALSESVRREFSVVDASGTVVARARGGDAKIPLPAGSYEIRLAGSDAPAAKADVKPNETATVELH